jgi:hypothetical protein
VRSRRAFLPILGFTCLERFLASIENALGFQYSLLSLFRLFNVNKMVSEMQTLKTRGEIRHKVPDFISKTSFSPPQWGGDAYPLLTLFKLERIACLDKENRESS